MPNDYMEWILKQKYGQLQREECYGDYMGAEGNVSSTQLHQGVPYYWFSLWDPQTGEEYAIYPSFGVYVLVNLNTWTQQNFTVDDIATPAHRDGKYRSFCNDPVALNR